MGYRAILFDCFRTLFEVGPAAPMMRADEPGWRPALEAVLAEVAPYLPELDRDAFLAAFEEVTRAFRREALASCRERRLEERVAAALSRLGYSQSDIARCGRIVAAVHRQHVVQNCRPYPGIPELVEALAVRCRLAVVSNFDDPLAVRQLLERSGLRRFFSAVVVSAEAGWRKPRAEIFQQALAATGVSAGHALFVGDSWEEDVLGATGAGMDAVWIHTATSETERPPAKWVIREVTQLAALPLLSAA